MVNLKKTELKLLADGYSYIYGVDEVGVGCLAGPVVVCVVALDQKFHDEIGARFSEVRDSKKLSPAARERLARELRQVKSFSYTLGYSHPRTIDRINIFQATRKAMARVVTKLITNNLQPTTKAIVLVDGPHRIRGVDLDQKPIVKGDQKVFAIACASIIAKVYRDRLMDRYARRFPGYGFEQHKGYSTKLHQNALKKHGPCAIHRRSFRLEY